MKTKIKNYIGKKILIGALALSNLAYAGPKEQESNALENQLSNSGYKLTYVVPTDVAKKRAERIKEYNQVQSQVKEIAPEKSRNYGGAIEKAIKDSDIEMEKIFRASFKGIYNATTNVTDLSPEQFFQGSDQNGDKKITPDEFEAYTENLLHIIQNMKGGKK